MQQARNLLHMHSLDRNIRWVCAFFVALYRVLDPVFFFRTFGIVESVQRADQITCDPADPMERNVSKIVGKLHIIAIHPDINSLRRGSEFFFSALDIGINFSLGQFPACNMNLTSHDGFTFLSSGLYTEPKRMKQDRKNFLVIPELHGNLHLYLGTAINFPPMEGFPGVYRDKVSNGDIAKSNAIASQML